MAYRYAPKFKITVEMKTGGSEARTVRLHTMHEENAPDARTARKHARILANILCPIAPGGVDPTWENSHSGAPGEMTVLRTTRDPSDPWGDRTMLIIWIEPAPGVLVI